MKRILTLIVLFILVAAVQTAPAADKITPTKITSDRLVYNQKRDSVIFEGRVHVTRPDMEIWADKLTAVLEQDSSKGKSTLPSEKESQQAKIKKIIAQGNVRLVQADKKGTCGKATYDMESGLLVMENNPKIVEGKNKIEGEVIKLNLKDHSSEVIGGKKRVEAIFFTTGEEEAPFK